MPVLRPPQARQSVHSPYVPLKEEMVSINILKGIVSDRTISSLRHAKDSIAFLKLLKRLNKGEDTNKYLDQFIVAIEKDEKIYIQELTHIKSGLFENITNEDVANNFGNSEGQECVFEDTTPTIELTNNPLL